MTETFGTIFHRRSLHPFLPPSPSCFVNHSLVCPVCAVSSIKIAVMVLGGLGIALGTGPA